MVTQARISKTPVVRELAALMQEHGVTRCVLCPGSRNAPLCATFCALPLFECRYVTDERSAGFAALGWAAQAQAPVAVCVTSGSAVLNLHPAVAEAYYRHIPLLVLSADRPAAWIGQQDGQTLPQPGVFGALVRASVDLPIEDTNGWRTNRLLNEALLELNHRNGGPVHINIPLAEPLFATDDTPLARPRIIRRTELARMSAQDEQELLEIVAALPKRLILLGQLATQPYFPPELTQDHAFAIVGEHLCNYPRADCTRPDTLVGRDADYPDIPPPDLLITMGGGIISKRLKHMLRNNPPAEHWHISPDGEVCDTFCCLTRVIEGDYAELTELLAAFAEDGDESYRKLWQTEPAAFSGGYCGMTLVGELMRAMPTPSVLHLGNSSAVRYAQLFPLQPGIQIECNRGVNGIEGSLSTAFGYAYGDKRLQFIVCGDLSFFYDMNALWMQNSPPANVRILLLNNGGGGIFKTIGTPKLDCVEGTHNATAEAWAKDRGFRYLCTHPTTDLTPIMAELTGESPCPILLEAFIDSNEDAQILKQFYTLH
ncbi:MAG: 2-succinyl-5-enolpyruvyl-6-hydroxy-3-cyclohexene-1-carboxylic-acid synthase [Akkermansiaceae bacterium]|nr:2-succinyl-5-enolpyruvyl-6-hydroxy-3-cyclohexene-1-carboxylic-acid synthase [Akkermansiaceae bacterium]